jgi:sRNA-binding protein
MVVRLEGMVSMGRDKSATFAKRARERARQEVKRQKAERRAQRRAEKGSDGSQPNDIDPDIADIVPGPQPPPEELID